MNQSHGVGSNYNLVLYFIVTLKMMAGDLLKSNIWLMQKASEKIFFKINLKFSHGSKFHFILMTRFFDAF